MALKRLVRAALAATLLAAPVALVAAPATAQAELGLAPDQAMKTLMSELGAGHPQAIWAFLPGSYQKDVNDLVHQIGGKLDAQLYDRTIAVVAKAVKVMKAQKQFILGNAKVREGLSAPGLPPGMVEQNWDTVLDMASVLLQTDLATAAGVKKLDVGKFLSGPAVQVTADIFKLAKAAGQDLAALAAGAKFELVGKINGDKARVKGQISAIAPPTEEDMVRVEGKWIPASMAQHWKESMTQASAELGQLPAEMAKAKAQIMPVLDKVDAALDRMAAAKDQAAFDAAVASIEADAAGPQATPVKPVKPIKPSKPLKAN